MDKTYLDIKKEAELILNEMPIENSDASINSILFEIIDSDDSNIDLKIKTLKEIKNLINIKRKIRIKNDDLYFLKNISEKLKQDIKIEDIEFNKLLEIIKDNF